MNRERERKTYREEGDDIGHQHMVSYGRNKLRSRHHFFFFHFKQRMIIISDWAKNNTQAENLV